MEGGAHLPPPLTSEDVDLRGMPYMPLDVVRLRDSDLIIMSSGEGFRAAVLLWCVAWHQVPAASLPDDDKTLAHLAGFGREIDAWMAVKDEATRGFVKCSDGRLYHKTMAEKAVEAWAARKRHREKLAKAREAKAAKQPPIEASYKESLIEPAKETIEAPSIGLKGREGKGRDIKESSNELSTRELRDLAERFYRAYPKHVDPREAEKRFLALVAKGDDPESIICAAERYAEAQRIAGTDKRFIPAPAVWLRKGGHLSEDLPAPEPMARAGPLRFERRNPYFQVLEEDGLEAASQYPAEQHDEFFGQTIDIAANGD
jgi:hypothetical protein